MKTGEIVIRREKLEGVVVRNVSSDLRRARDERLAQISMMEMGPDEAQAHREAWAIIGLRRIIGFEQRWS